MRSSTFVSTVVLLASAVAAQSTASEQIFTVQTSIPTAFQSRSTGVVDCNCIQEPCTACSSEGFMSIPPGETPLDSASIVSIITDPLLSTVTGIMSIPPGETPITTGSLDKPSSSGAPTSRPSSLLPSLIGPSSTSSAPAQQTSNAASRALNDGNQLVLALAGAAVALL